MHFLRSPVLLPQMRVLTWNVNVLATTLQYHPWSEKKSFKVLLDALESDIICIQEVKCQRSKITKEMAMIPGYNAYFSFSKVKLGYSGVVVYVKDTLVPQPIRAWEGITGILDKNDNDDGFEYNLGTPAEILDAEGRCIVLDFGCFILFNVYFPADSDESRTGFKMDYHHCVQQRIEFYLRQGRQVLLVGDINACHEEIDHCDPKQSLKDHNITDFKDLPHRRWLDNILDPKGPLIDMTRLYHPGRKKMFTCWNTRLNTRPANFGSRIDFVLASKGLKPWFKYSDIQPEIMGSDHCPVYADFLDVIANGYENNNTTQAMASPLLASNFPEFSNQQKKLSNYFAKSNSAPPSPIPLSEPTTKIATPSPSPSSGVSGLKRSSSQSRSVPSSNSKKPKSNNTSLKSPQKSIQSFFTTSKKADDSISIPKSINDAAKKVIQVKEEKVKKGDVKAEAEEEVNIEELIAEVQEKEVTAKAWTSLFSAPEVPRCKVHNEPCLERKVTKKGPNLGRIFYVCAKPIGPKDAPAYEYHCNFFQWKSSATK